METRTRPAQRLAMLAALCCLLLAAPATANIVSFDPQPLGTAYGAPAGHVPGDWIFAEDMADLRVHEFLIGGTPYYNFCRIDAPFAGFGSGRILGVNNVGVIVDFNAPGDASFDFLDLGGSVNIQVNGYGIVIEAQDFPSLGTFMIAPGVIMNTTWSSIGGGIAGTVNLSGPVHQVRIGGQELWIDDVKCDNGIGSGVLPCLTGVDYETLPLGITFGAAAGHAPGDLIFNEGGIDVFAMEFDAGSAMLFHRMDVVGSFGPFQPQRIMQVTNICQEFDLAPLGMTTGTVTFDYLDFGGTENLMINGSPVMVGDLDTFHGLTLGGVNVEVATMSYGSGALFGHVTLHGDVQRLRVGGQEFFMDDLCVEGDEDPQPCDRLVHHESLSIGDAWGAPFGTSPGTHLFTEDGVPVSIGEYLSVTGGWYYNSCRVEGALAGFGLSQVMAMNNVVNVYDIGATGLTTTEVIFEYLDLGGEENLEVNGHMRYVGDLHLAPAVIAPGVSCSVTTIPVPGGVRGSVTLTGAVDKLVVGGQEFWIDNICVIGEETGPVLWCDHLSDIESPAIGSAWGGGVGSMPGDPMFTEDAMDARVLEYTDPFGATFFGTARVDPAFAGFGNGAQFLTLSNVMAGYDLSALGPVEKVRFRYFDGAGLENLQVNGGPLFIGEIGAAPANIAPGIVCTVYEAPGPGYATGVVVLEGNVQRLLVGGQQFAIDDVCARLSGSTSDVSRTPLASVRLEPNFPNPFNPSTTLKFSLGAAGPVRLTVHDAAGRVVRSLLNEERAAGPHSLVWDGRRDDGVEAAAGVYFVRVESRTGVDALKIALIK